ncbi:MAG TPA: hypothetical protein DCF33_18280, partial [Saprospirales bacterium]|nr:hypothetical protein [Saprospirales bacterium]
NDIPGCLWVYRLAFSRPPFTDFAIWTIQTIFRNYKTTKVMKNKQIFLFVLILFAAMNSLLAQKEETVAGNRGLGFSGIWGGSKHQLANFSQNNTNSYMAG